jgi:AbrB family looped-hinge helix DNA binding protein
MTAYHAKITSKGQITLPKPVREALGVSPGDEVSFEVGKDDVAVRPLRVESSFRAWEGRWREGEGLSREQVDQWIHEIRGHDEDWPWRRSTPTS